ncbi:MAG: hypothetical protein QXI19_08505, partial [Candidatus Caldarchaeum sp.]
MWPYAYTRSTAATPSKLRLSAEIVLTGEWRGGDIWVKASGPDDIRLDPLKATVSDMDKTRIRISSAEAASSFPDTVKAYAGNNVFTLRWQLSSDSASTGWTNAGTTKNPLYLTFAAPSLGPLVELYHTLV